jgi:hypothetical protein
MSQPAEATFLGINADAECGLLCGWCQLGYFCLLNNNLTLTRISIRLNLRIQNLRNSIARFLQMRPRISIRVPIQIPNTLTQTLRQLPQFLPSQTPRIFRNIRFSQHHPNQNRQMFPLQRTPKSRNLHLFIRRLQLFICDRILVYTFRSLLSA